MCAMHSICFWMTLLYYPTCRCIFCGKMNYNMTQNWSIFKTLLKHSWSIVGSYSMHNLKHILNHCSTYIFKYICSISWNIAWNIVWNIVWRIFWESLSNYTSTSASKYVWKYVSNQTSIYISNWASYCVLIYTLNNASSPKKKKHLSLQKISWKYLKINIHAITEIIKSKLCLNLKFHLCFKYDSTYVSLMLQLYFNYDSTMLQQCFNYALSVHYITRHVARKITTRSTQTS